MSSDSEFYIGYQSHAPARLGRWMKWVVSLIIIEAIVFGLLVLFLEKPFDPGAFEFGIVKEFEGVVKLDPVPALYDVDLIGSDASSVEASEILLVSPGKWTATPLVADFDGQRVRMKGSLIYRDQIVMLEVRPESVHPVDSGGASSFSLPDSEILGRRELTGEIVDAKCFLGVMKPGREKTHRSCAARCISGGIPPMLATTTSAGDEVFYLLLDSDGRPVNDRVLEFVAEPIAITGEIRSQASHLYLLADLGTIRRTSE